MRLVYFVWFFIVSSFLAYAEVQNLTFPYVEYESLDKELPSISSITDHSPIEIEAEQETRARIEGLKFAEELKAVYGQVIKITKHIDASTTLIEALETMEGVETSFACKSCEAFVTDLGKIAKSHIIVEIIDDLSSQACSLFLNKTVCSQIVSTFTGILFTNLWIKEFNPSFACSQLLICPKNYQKETLKEYIKEVLHDKPDVPFPTPTKRNSIKVLHLTDVHLDFEYLEGTNADCNEPLCCRPENGGAPSPSQAAQYWGTVTKCDLPPRTFDEFARFASQETDVDMIIWTGDSTAHNVWHQSSANQTYNTYYVTKILEQYFPNIPIYPMFGNHEVYPADQFDFFNHTTDWLLVELSDVWKGWLGEEAYETFRNKSYYSIYNEEYNLRIIALDTQTCDAIDFFMLRNDTDPLGQLAWLRNELYQAEADKEPVFIIGHIPPGESYCDSAWAGRYRALMDRFGYLITGQFFGHTHTDQVEIMTSYENNSTVGVAYINPSLTTFSSLNPSFRIYEVDRDTSVLLNYEQYRLNLTKWNQKTTEPIEWDLAYNFLDEYNLKDMNPVSIENFVENLKLNRTLMDLYAFNLDSGAHSLKKISNKNAKQRYCLAKHSVYEQAVECMGFDASIVSIFHLVMQLLPGPWYGQFRHC